MKRVGFHKIQFVEFVIRVFTASELPSYNQNIFEIEAKRHKGMNRLLRQIKKFFGEDLGQDLVEYSLIMAFVALASAGLFASSGGSVSNIWGQANVTLSNAATSSSNSNSGNSGNTVNTVNNGGCDPGFVQFNGRCVN